MSEILSNTGVKLWSETDYNELWLTVFDQLTGQGGKSNIRLIDEAIGKINTTLDGYKFEFSSDEDRLYISKGDLKLPVSLIDSNGHVASKVDGTTITIDESGVVKGVPVDDALSEESTNPLQNKVIAGELKSIKSKMGTDESAIKQNTSDITNNTKRIEANETAISTLNGNGDGSVKKAVSDGIAEVVAGAPEDFDTLKEMSDWISSHESSASAMNTQIQENKKNLTNHATDDDIHVTTDDKTKWNKVEDKLDRIGDASNTTVSFTTPSTRKNLTTKEKLSIGFGKISKWFSDLKAVAFSGSYNDLSNKPTSLPANGGNSSTVNNHTVKSDVPENAKFTDTTYSDATTTTHGLMSATDKKVLDVLNKPLATCATGRATVAKVATLQNFTLQVGSTVAVKFTDTGTSNPTSGNLTLNVNGTGAKTIGYFRNGNKAALTYSVGNLFYNNLTHIFMYDGTYWLCVDWNADNNTTYNDATTSSHGLMTSTMVTKLNGIANGANKTIVDSSMSSTSTNPVQNKVVDAAIVKKADTILYDKSVSTLYLKSGSTVLSSTEIKSGGGATITPKPTVNPQIKNDDKKVVITWEDPTNTVIDGSTFSTWAGTKLVMKESGYPTSPDDGTLLVDNTTRDKYKTTGFTKTGLTNDKVYYFALFPYSTDGVYNYDSGNRLLGEPTELKIVTFSSGTDAEIARMIQAHYANKINISDYWAVGDTRSVALSAMSATGVGESHRAQTVQFVIGGFDHDDLATAINGHTKAAVTLLQKDCLMDATSAGNSNNGSNDTEKGYMNSSSTNSGGWKSCARRTWCNNVYFAALPTTWQNMVKTVNKKSGTGGGSYSGTEVTADKIFLASEIEIFGSTTNSVAGEGTQYQYYKNATANRYKMPKWDSSSVSHAYWERSPHSGYADRFCHVDSSGSASTRSASISYGVAPCLCI